ncbi:glutamyl-tRNA synthetase [Myxococcaceae bacterium]|jgi:glutamyl-tRNA synthetase|nr:glutamyl-tRNA synthetase [Myxococcaceae bacterium]
MSVRTRFAPSPTGFLHIGGARTALFNWAFARRHGGSFLLRIEDTDRERSTAESEAAVLDGLRWLGIDWDEGPHRQSERIARHREVVEGLLDRGAAYRCVCTREALETRKQETIAAGHKWTYDGRCRDARLGADCGPHTVRLRLPAEGNLGWDDLVYGPSGQDAREIGDMIIRRSDGGPLYHLAVVVDDVDMGITHVIRGADHHSNTPFQIAIYRALGATPPRFAHVPLIVGADGKKLSKRRDPVSVQQFRAEGHPVDAMRNWLVRTGWSHGDQEIFSRDEIAALFDLDSVQRASARADAAKLSWLSQHYLKTLPQEALFSELGPFLEKVAGHPVERTADLERLVDLLRERSRTLLEMAELARFFVHDVVAYDEKAATKFLTRTIEPVLSALHERLVALEDWTVPALEAVFDEVRAAHDDLPLGKLAQPVRVAITGSTVSPPIFDTLEVLGKARSVGRLAEGLHFARHGA